MSYVKKTPLEGDLSEVWLPHIFIKILMMNLTGVLILKLEDRTSEVYFRKGHVVHIKSDHKADRFGQFLVRIGVLQESDVDDVIASQKDNPNLKFGDLLVKNQLVEPHRMMELLNEHHAERLYYIFEHKVGSYRYVKRSQWSEDTSVFELQTHRIYFEAVERFYVIDEIKEYITIDDTSFLKKNLSHRVEFPLPPLPSKVLYSIQETIDIESLIKKLAQPREKIYPIVFVLVMAGWVEVVADASGTRKIHSDKQVSEVTKQKMDLEYPYFLKKNYFEIFSVPLQLNPQKVQTNFLNLMKKYSEYKGTVKGDQVLEWIKVGYQVLINKDLRLRYVKRLKALDGNADKLVDDRTFFHGLYLLEQDKEDQAAAKFSMVAQKHPSDSMYKSYHHATKFLENPSKDIFPECYKVLEDNLSTVRSESYLGYAFAQMYLFAKKDKKAEEILSEIVEREQSYPKAQDLLDDLRFKRAKDKQGDAEADKAPESVLKKLFFTPIGGAKEAGPAADEDEEELDEE